MQILFREIICNFIPISSTWEKQRNCSKLPTPSLNVGYDQVFGAMQRRWNWVEPIAPVNLITTSINGTATKEKNRGKKYKWRRFSVPFVRSLHLKGKNGRYSVRLPALPKRFEDHNKVSWLALPDYIPNISVLYEVTYFQFASLLSYFCHSTLCWSSTQNYFCTCCFRAYFRIECWLNFCSATSFHFALNSIRKATPRFLAPSYQMSQ